MNYTVVVRDAQSHKVIRLTLGLVVIIIILTSCTTQPTTIPSRSEVSQSSAANALASPSSLSGSVLSTAKSSSVTLESSTPPSTPQMPQTTPTLSSPGISPSTSTDESNNLSQKYTNTREGYSILIPSDWTVSTSDTGTAYFLNQQGLVERNKGLSDWEAALGGVQFVGRNPQLTENEQYESILPNHCSIVGWKIFKAIGATGRLYTLDCDNPALSGTIQRQHVYIPQGNRFIEFWLNVESVSSSEPEPLLVAIINGFSFNSR